MILIAAFGYAVGPMVLKRTLADLDPRATMGASLLLAVDRAGARRRRSVRPPRCRPRRRSSRSSSSASFCTAAAFVVFGILIARPGRAGRRSSRTSHR